MLNHDICYKLILIFYIKNVLYFVEMYCLHIYLFILHIHIYPYDK